MSYYVSNLIGIRTGGVFAGPADIEDLKRRIFSIIDQLKSEENEIWSDIPDNKPIWEQCISRELVASKGSYVVVAGVFNFWSWEKSSEFSRRLSKEFGTEIMHICWNEETGEVNHGVFLDGKLRDDVDENPIGSIMRRVT